MIHKAALVFLTSLAGFACADLLGGNELAFDREPVDPRAGDASGQDDPPAIGSAAPGGTPSVAPDGGPREPKRDGGDGGMPPDSSASGGPAGADAGADADAPDSEPEAEEPALAVIPVPPGHLPYCSVLHESGVGWGFAWGGEDPCGWMLELFGWGPEKIRRAGFFDAVGRNHVVMHCPQAGVLGHWTGPGAAPLDAAYRRAADVYVYADCFFMVAPERLPVFVAPFSLNPLPPGFEMSNHDYDFASIPGNPGAAVAQATLDVREYSQNAQEPSACEVPYPGCAPTVSYRGEDRSGASEDNSHGFEWTMDSGAEVRALADGEVIVKRSRAVTACPAEPQQELYVRHVVGPTSASPYVEIFVAYYAHLEISEELQVGDVVRAGETVGRAGIKGCSDGSSRVHLAVLRLSNTTRDYRPELDTTPGVYGDGGTNPDDSVARIDPYGWKPSQDIPHLDPGGYAWYWTEIPGLGPNGTTRLGGGALSIDLWMEGEAPPRPCDRNDIAWPVANGPPNINPYAHCER